ncbi:MAG: hypothetical protein EBW55_11040, partial [Betaproteobacteria bacterium]|nr:hypothetical protein [Betaproteobacteria bacterium]
MLVNGPCHLFTLGAKLVAVNGVAQQVMDSAKLLVLVQASLRIYVVQEVVLVATLINVQVPVPMHISGHVLGPVVIALTSAVVREVVRQ